MHNLTPALARGRAAAEALMQDECTITRKGAGAPVFDPATGTYPDPDPVTVYTGVCRVQVASSLDVRTVDFGGEAVNLSRIEVRIPIDSTVVLPEDVVTVTAAEHDPALVGQTLTVKGVEAKSQATVRRIECERTL